MSDNGIFDNSASDNTEEPLQLRCPLPFTWRDTFGFIDFRHIQRQRQTERMQEKLHELDFS